MAGSKKQSKLQVIKSVREKEPDRDNHLKDYTEEEIKIIKLISDIYVYSLIQIIDNQYKVA